MSIIWLLSVAGGSKGSEEAEVEELEETQIGGCAEETFEGQEEGCQT